MFWPLALILLAVAAFDLLLARRRPASLSEAAVPDQLAGFLYVGAGSLLVLAVGVVALGLLDDSNGRAETVAVLGLGAYAVYLVAAGVVTHVTGRAQRRR